MDHRQRRWLGITAAAACTAIAFGAGLGIGVRNAPASAISLGAIADPISPTVSTAGTADQPRSIAAVPEYRALADLSHQLDQEGLVSTAKVLDDNLVDSATMEEQRKSTDRAIATWQSVSNRQSMDSAQALQRRIEQLPVNRAAVDGRQISPRQSAEQFQAASTEARTTFQTLAIAEPNGRAFVAPFGISCLLEAQGLHAEEAVAILLFGSDELAQPSPRYQQRRIEETNASLAAKFECINTLHRVEEKQMIRDALGLDTGWDEIETSVLDAIAANQQPNIDRTVTFNEASQHHDAYAAALSKIMSTW